MTVEEKKCRIYDLISERETLQLKILEINKEVAELDKSLKND